MRGNASSTLELASVPLQRQDLLGVEGDQIWFVFHVIAPYFLAAMAGTYLGVAGRALEVAQAHIDTRSYTTWGMGPADEPVVLHGVGTVWAGLLATRRLAYWAADEYDRGGADALPAVLAMKAEVGDCAERLTNEALTLVGGVGYREGSVLHRLLRDARAAHVMAPTTDMLRSWTGRALLGRPVL
jgi:alkylation response protein AidB-like acyl-CoA dehydrogenase